MLTCPLPLAPASAACSLRRRQLALSSPAAPRRRAAATRASAADSTAATAAGEDPATAFDWELGLALAGCAFEAYNELEGAEEAGEGGPAAAAAGGLKMTSNGGTEVTFVDK